jgi:hypothetical protein
LRAAVGPARALGRFGTPSFVVVGESFWGKHRLDAALDWAKWHPSVVQQATVCIRPPRPEQTTVRPFVVKG